jgi:streptogrisin C
MLVRIVQLVGALLCFLVPPAAAQILSPPAPAPIVQILPAAPVAAPPPIATLGPAPLRETPADALNEDAREYARQFAVTIDEARRRLVAQDASVAATDTIADTYRDRLAGIAIEHRPSYRILVYLTGTTPVASKHVVVGNFSVPIEFRTGARVTRDRVIWAMTNQQSAIRAALRSPPGMGLDPRTGELVITIGSLDARDGIDGIRQRIEAIAGVPVQVRALDHVDVNLAVEGGARVEGVDPDDGKRYLCTSGFAVTDGTRDAITTAAHCVDQLSYRDRTGTRVALPFVAQWGWGYRDVQINASPERLEPTFFADTAKTRVRAVTGTRSRASTRAGDFVCHRGERTGYSCAVVQLTDFAPAGDLCGGACLPTWVTVSGPTCKGGDSGSPVFTGTTALGIVKGASYRRDGSCAFYFYMALEYLPDGWAVLRVPQPSGTAGLMR